MGIDLSRFKVIHGDKVLNEAILHCEGRAKADCSECADEHRQLAEWLKELRVLGKNWIPVAEKLPKAKEDVLVCTKSGWILIAWYGPNGQRWHITPSDAGITREDIVAWMPLPEPFNQQN